MANAGETPDSGTTPTTTATRTAAIVFNPVKADVEALREAVAAAEAEHGWAETRWYETSVEDAGQGVTKQALEEGADLVVAAGGDGTVRAVAEGMRDSGVPLGLVPAGTGNLLARNLDFKPGDHANAIDVAFGGNERTIDAGIAQIEHEDGSRSEHLYTVMAGFGLDAKMIAKTDEKLKKRVGWLAYIDGGVRALVELKPVRVQYSLDGRPTRSMKVHTILLGNCGQLPGGILLMPEARPDDGILDIVALRPEGPFGWLKVWNKLVFENGVLRKSAAGRKLIDLDKDVRSVTSLRGRKLVLRVEEAQEFQLDGDEMGTAIAVNSWIDEGALRVMVPAA
jgi:diacylglycerol kinase (ATP)